MHFSSRLSSQNNEMRGKLGMNGKYSALKCANIISKSSKVNFFVSFTRAKKTDKTPQNFHVS